MDYGEAVAAFFAPRPEGTPLPEAVTAGAPARRLRDACEPVAMHAVWSPLTNERLATLGLDFLTSYVGGRAAALGEPVGAVVAATFAWFSPELVTTVYDAARQAVSRERLLAERDAATSESLRGVLDAAGVVEAEIVGVADVLASAVEPADGTGRPLFSGLRSRGRPVDAVQRLWWACDLVREHRGDSHVAAASAAGLAALEMNVLTELWLGMPMLSYTGTRGWSEDAMRTAVAGLEARGWVRDAALTEGGRAVRAQVEEHTDAQERQVVDALGERLDAVCEQLNRWGAHCVAAGAFPADTLKRAAG